MSLVWNKLGFFVYYGRFLSLEDGGALVLVLMISLYTVCLLD
jgi:hypothetical protein